MMNIFELEYQTHHNFHDELKLGTMEKLRSELLSHSPTPVDSTAVIFRHLGTREP